MRKFLLGCLFVSGCAPTLGSDAHIRLSETTLAKTFSVCEIIADDDRLLGQTVTVRAPYETDYSHFAGLNGPECRRALQIDVEGRDAPGVDDVRKMLDEIEGTERRLFVTVNGRLKRCALSHLCVAIVPNSYSEFEIVGPQQP
ncbi:hypothetical protein [Brevundimonas sp.]|uniref:hypothetical protein n=1 Tax=Brevundimonas sp. TaxID=1871086 RepID=UPI002D42727D|nr:hypothetical protein [Brevundimonas sp.]HYC68831.1 hypothetical protein [Brevundimonas sp.]